MTTEAPVWEPSDTDFSEKEDKITELKDKFISSETTTRVQRIINHLFTSKDHAVDFKDDDNFYKAVNAKVNVANVKVSKGRHEVTLEYLSQK